MLRRLLSLVGQRPVPHGLYLPVVEFDALFPALANARVILEHCASCLGGVRLNELVALACLAQYRDALQVFEFGTGTGRTTLNIALNLRPGGRVFSLDLPEGASPDPAVYCRDQASEVASGDKAMFVRARLSNLPIDLLRGESTTFDFSPWSQRIDIVFIDGGHSRKAVESDTANAFRMLKPSGGVVLWHDYLPQSCPAVVDYLNSLSRKLPVRLLAGTKTAVCITNDEMKLP